ncbi:serine/threonine-protein kinase [Nocardiopsis ansamitocini]|nr:serine/threonine-protein kinase [Nocardiopsis ansamitocini]
MTTAPDEERLVCDRYLLGAELGRGGMGRVWRAHDRRLNRTVALKELLLPESLDGAERERLSLRMGREAQAAAMGAHPSIVTVHDVIHDDDRPWIVMEFLTGRSLKQAMTQDGPQQPLQVAAWGSSVLDALHTAHGLGILHRDVKPANIMVTDSGRAVLTDFGIAVIEGDSSLTQTNGLVGSPAYLSPERLSFAPASTASDLWALGATLHGALTGISPFHRQSLEGTVLAVRREDPPPLGADVPPPLAAAVRGLLDKDPNRRMGAEEARGLLGAAMAPHQHAWTPHSPTGPGTPAWGTTPLPGTMEPWTAQRDVRPQGGTGTTGGSPTGPQYHRPPETTAPGRHTGPQPHQPGPKASRFSLPLLLGALGAVLGAAALVAVLASGLFLISGEDGTGEDGALGDTSSEGVNAGGEAPARPTGAEDFAESGAELPDGMVQDPAGFTIVVPEGWERRVQGDSVYFDSPGGSYLQIDQRPNQSDDQYQNLVENEHHALTAGSFPGYEQIRLEDVTEQVGYVSVAEWEFTYDSGERSRRVMTRNITVAEGQYVTLAWGTPAEAWDEQEGIREESLASFAPN